MTVSQPVRVIDHNGREVTPLNPLPTTGGAVAGSTGAVKLIDPSAVDIDASNPLPANLIDSTGTPFDETNPFPSVLVDSGGTPIDSANPLPVQVVTDVVKTAGTATGALALVATATANQRFTQATIRLSAVPVTSELLRIWVRPVAGAMFDTLLLEIDPSVEGASHFFFIPDEALWLVAGDRITVEFDNTDANTYGAQITMVS